MKKASRPMDLTGSPTKDTHMPNHVQDIYSDFEAFSALVDAISLDDLDAHRRFCGTKNPERGMLESESESFEPKVTAIPDLWGRKKERSIHTWLRNRTSSLDFGKEIVDKDGERHPIHLNSNKKVENFFEDLRFGRKPRLKKIKDRNFLDHRMEIGTFYFAGNSDPKYDETLVLIDIDCKKFGSLEGALAFAQFLKEHFFPNLYMEVSTHGKGAHGFFVLEKCGCGAEFINDLLLQRLQPWLRQVMREQGFDVENVEIKGTLPVIDWGESKYEVLSYKSGTLAKLPRIPTPEHEKLLRQTTMVTAEQLQQLPVFSVDRPGKSSSNDATSGLRVVAGSITGKHITEDELEAVDGHYRRVAESLLEAHALETSGKTKITVEDVAIWLMLIKFFTRNMNRDGSMPVDRWRQMWKSVFRSGDINRSFCCQRFSTIRDHLSKLGLLTWEDHEFRLGYIDENGKYRKGKACKWKASDELMAMLELPADSEVEEGEKGKASFVRTTLLDFFRSLGKLPESMTIRPMLVLPEPPRMLDPDEINRFIKPFEAFSGLAA